MKTKVLLFAILACSQFTIAQVEVDSSFIVRDTLTVEDDARVGHNLEVDENALIKQDLEVDGATELHDVIILGTTQMKSLQDLDTNDFGILVTNSDGTVMKSKPGTLFPVPQDPLGICDIPGNPYSTSPYWVSQPNKLYTACPDVFVGVNTNAPRTGLDVIGTTYSQRLFMGDADPTITNSDLYFHLDVPLDNADDQTVFKVENNDRQLFSINSTGLVRSREIKIDAQLWADFVFQPSYELRTLGEVESFIEENGHLPDVPSEKVVLEEGINVAEMNALLLQKIEELTLYTIALEKRLAVVENQND